MAEPIKLFWWPKADNFGDKLSPRIVEYVSGRDVVWSGPHDANLFALGSVMNKVRARTKFPERGIPAVWGAGCIGPMRNDFAKAVKFSAVRGPLTRLQLGLSEEVALGDPGLLVKRLYDGKLARSKQWQLGLVLHHSQAVTPELEEILENQQRSTIISARSSSPFEVVDKIASCDAVLSTSLHGLITADALGIPNNWLNPKGIHVSSRFKFYDYGLSVGRAFREPFGISNIPAALRQIEEMDFGYMRSIEEMNDKLSVALLTLTDEALAAEPNN